MSLFSCQCLDVKNVTDCVFTILQLVVIRARAANFPFKVSIESLQLFLSKRAPPATETIAEPPYPGSWCQGCQIFLFVNLPKRPSKQATGHTDTKVRSSGMQASVPPGNHRGQFLTTCVCPLWGMFTPSFTNKGDQFLLFRRMDRKFHPHGITSPLRDCFAPGGQCLPLGAN
jgi:hypothetical protein